jgi:hypothetical protein
MARITNKQKGDACEMLVAAELTLAGVPALKVPDNWPDYDVIAQPPGKDPQTVSVKSRTFKRGSAFVIYEATDEFDWLAIVILPADTENQRKFFIIPRGIADKKMRQDGPTAKTNQRYCRVDKVGEIFKRFERNFSLRSDDEIDNNPDPHV